MRKGLIVLLLALPLSLFATAPKAKHSARKTTLTKCHWTTECTTGKPCHHVKICSHTREPHTWVVTAMNDITGTEESALDKRLHNEHQINKNKYGITFDQPTYILPYYHTTNPSQDVGPTPRNQAIMKDEFKAHLSLQFPLWANMFNSNYSIGASYTQLSYWQVYANSQFFRETNYMPALFVSDHFLPNWQLKVGGVHESNGRGGDYERSWNRAYANLTFSGQQWMISIKPWVLIFKKNSSDIHNKNIAHYLGYERVVIAYKAYSQEWSMMLRNSIESGFQRSALELDYSFPIHGFLRGYLQFFHGYGQSLIEYNHKTNAVGVGITLSNWI